MSTDHKHRPHLAPLIAYYNPLLTRYARMITRNEDIVWQLVKKVLEDQYEIDGLHPSGHLRSILKTNLRDLCLSHNLQRDAADFKGRAFTEDDIEKPFSQKDIL